MTTERTQANKLVDAALAKGWTVSVCDGEEWTVKKSTDAKAIKASLMSTDEDILRFRRADGTKIGMVVLVYGNSPEELFSDHSDNEEINALVKSVEV
jgi:hypothetical protein